MMNGAESLLRTAVAAGVEVCFANPGTTEIPLVLALERVPEMRAVLCLFEGVCTGAADGYGRMAGKPALTLLHLGPGFANGVACLHDARRARSPIVNVVGEHATWHLPADAPLTSDIASLARPVSAWLRTAESGAGLADDVAEAVAYAAAPPGRIATLIAPHDYLLAESSGPAKPRPVQPPHEVSDNAVKQSVEALRKHSPAALFLGGAALGVRGLRAAARIAAATGCRLLAETFPKRQERGAGTPPIERLPYFPEPGHELLAPFRAVVLAGAPPPVTFFGYPGVPSYFISPDKHTAVLAAPTEDVEAALEALADALNAPADAPIKSNSARPARPRGALTPDSLAAAVAAVQPEHAVVVDEGITSSLSYFAASSAAPPFTYLTQGGGAIGLGPPCATGAAIACPARAVINLQADGSAMYTLQALWTQAREGLNVTTLICNNRSYKIIGVELMRAGVREVGGQAQNLMSLANPPLDWVKLAGGLGVPGARVETAEALTRELERALQEAGPHLIEVMI
jgi:acetolactate synthase I/II/III large subunit